MLPMPEESKIIYQEQNRLNNILCNQVMTRTTKAQQDPVFGYEFCELEQDMLGFLENYADLENLPKNYTIIDFGCNQAMQSAFFQNHKCYIGVEPDVPIKNRLITPHSKHYECTIKTFITRNLPVLQQNGLDLNKTFAICSAVPDFKETNMIPEIFPNYRIAYPGEKTLAHYPNGFQPYANYPEHLAKHLIANHKIENAETNVPNISDDLSITF